MGAWSKLCAIAEKVRLDQVMAVVPPHDAADKIFHGTVVFNCDMR